MRILWGCYSKLPKLHLNHNLHSLQPILHSECSLYMLSLQHIYVWVYGLRLKYSLHKMQLRISSCWWLLKHSWLHCCQSEGYLHLMQLHFFHCLTYQRDMRLQKRSSGRTILHGNYRLCKCY